MAPTCSSQRLATSTAFKLLGNTEQRMNYHLHSAPSTRMSTARLHSILRQALYSAALSLSTQSTQHKDFLPTIKKIEWWGHNADNYVQSNGQELRRNSTSVEQVWTWQVWCFPYVAIHPQEILMGETGMHKIHSDILPAPSSGLKWSGT